MAVACAAALLSCSVAFADTTDTPTPSSSTSPTAPAVQPRKPADTGSAIQTPVDQQTEAFRKALAEKQARLDAFNAQLDALDKDLEIASQQYYAAADALEATKSKVSVAQSDLDTARQAYGVQASILGQRASSMYKDGSFGAFEVLLSSKSVSDFIARVKFLNTVGLADADIAASLKAQKDVMEKQMVELKNSQSQAEALEFEMKARQIEIMLRIQERQQMYADAQTDLLSMLDKEAARRRYRATMRGPNPPGAAKSNVIPAGKLVGLSRIVPSQPDMPPDQLGKRRFGFFPHILSQQFVIVRSHFQPVTPADSQNRTNHPPSQRTETFFSNLKFPARVSS